MILVFGKTGQVAIELGRSGEAVTLLGRDDADLTDPAACAAAIRSASPKAVINAAAYTAVDRAESEPEIAEAVNAQAPAAMAEVCAELGIPFVHISTDYVFDGTGNAPFPPDAATGPLGVYGQTKLQGEDAIRQSGATYAILRTSWVFSAHGANFVKTMLRLAETRDSLNIVGDQIGGPTPAKDIASACLAIAADLQNSPEHSGTYHFSGAPDVSWADFAREIFRQSGRSVMVADIPTSDYPTPAKRPANSRLDCTALANFGLARPDWKAGLNDVILELEEAMTTRKGIILAGGSGTRLYPLTIAVSKQLMPIFDKPMIYYPLSVLMLSGIRQVAIITTPDDQDQFKRLLGDGSQWGMELEYIVQPSPDGLAQAYILAEDFLAGEPSVMVLGDNIFFGHGLPAALNSANARETGGTVFGYHVADPERYGVVGFDAEGRVNQIIEKPANPPSNYAVTGLYFLDGEAAERAKTIKPSHRGELEITSLLETYLLDGTLAIETMGRGFAWLDTGTHSSLLDASNFVRTLVLRQGMQVSCPEEIAYNQGWISRDELIARASIFSKSDYGQYLLSLGQAER